MSFFQYVGYDSTAISRPIFCQNFTVPGLGLLWITLLLRKKLHNSAKDGLRNPAPSSKKNSRKVRALFELRQTLMTWYVSWYVSWYVLWKIQKTTEGPIHSKVIYHFPIERLQENEWGKHSHNPILANFIRSNVRTWKIWIVQASPWCVEPCSGGLDLQELKRNSTPESKGGPHWKNEFTEVPPLVHRQKNFF